jgi:uncharacterized protein with PQ loop repeat
MDWTTLETHVWASSFLNAVFLGFQLFRLWQTKSAKGLSLIMLFGFLYGQVIYTLYGYRVQQNGILYGVGASAVITSLVIYLAVKYRLRDATRRN